MRRRIPAAAAVRRGVPGWALLLLLLAALPARAQRWEIVDPGQGAVPLPSAATGAAELSGLAWLGDDRYYAISDRDPWLYPLRLEVDPGDGRIRAAALDRGVWLAGSTDLEGVVVDPADGSVLVSDEVGPAIRRYRPADGRLLASLPVPPVFAGVRRNLGLESLSLSPDGRTLWTANEEALRSDGAIAGFGAGTLVRLQRYSVAALPSGPQGASEGEDAPRPEGGPRPPHLGLPPHGGTPRAAWSPSGQWAYRTDAIPGDVRGAGRDVEASGVTELVAMPDGALLVLERAYGAGGTRSRLYEVDATGATDTGAMPALRGAALATVRKTLLWERTFADANFEGAALGPPLASGGRSLVLVSDNGHALRQALYGLAVRQLTK